MVFWGGGRILGVRSMPVPGRGAIWDWNAADAILSYLEVRQVSQNLVFH